jgi:hypothetical protein
MNIWEIDKLQLFLMFLLPGFISIKIYDLIISGERRDFSKAIIEAIAYSSLNFVLLSWLIALINNGNFPNEHQVVYAILIILIMFGFPVIWPIIFLRITEWKPIASKIYYPIQKPWDWYFRKGEPCWVIVHLKDGRKIGGKFDENSFASSFPAEEQIYLEEIWKLDKKGVFLYPVERSKGTIIFSEEMLSVESFKA